MTTDLLRNVLNGLLDHVERGDITTPLVVLLVVMAIPTLWATYVRFYLLKKVEAGWDARVRDKEKQITQLNSRLTQVLKIVDAGAKTEKESNATERKRK